MPLKCGSCLSLLAAVRPTEFVNDSVRNNAYLFLRNHRHPAGSICHVVFSQSRGGLATCGTILAYQFAVANKKTAASCCRLLSVLFVWAVFAAAVAAPPSCKEKLPTERLNLFRFLLFLLAALLFFFHSTSCSYLSCSRRRLGNKLPRGCRIRGIFG